VFPARLAGPDGLAGEVPFVRKLQRRLAGVDEIVLSLYAKGCRPSMHPMTGGTRGTAGERSDSSALRCAKDSGAGVVSTWYW
jgi:hypothetical protein